MKEIFNKLILPIKRKIFLLIGRGVLSMINNSESTQKIQITGLDGETITDIERFQEYGFESYPKANAEALTLFINGNRDHGIAICIHDRTYRPTDLVEGDVRVYNWSGNKITLTNNGIEIEDKNSNKIEMISGEINITGTKINLLGATEAFINGDTFDTWITGTLKTIFDAHVHAGVTAGGASSGVPVTPLVAPTGHLSTKIKGE